MCLKTECGKENKGSRRKQNQKLTEIIKSKLQSKL
jgi:hypothetical protein